MLRYWRGPSGRKTGLLKSIPGLLDLRSTLMLKQAPVKAEAHSRGLKGRKRVSSIVELGVSFDSVVR